MVLIVIGVLPGHNGRIGHHDHTHFIGQTRALLRDSAIRLVGTRSTRSPRAIKNRSKDPDTCRQSSSAQTRSASSSRPHTSSAANPARPTWTVRSPTNSPVVAPTPAIVCERLCVSAPSTIMTLVLLCDCRWTAGGHGLLRALPRSYQVTPDIPDRRRATKQKEVRPAGRQPQRESARRRSGPSSQRRTSPTPRITTASLEAAAPSTRRLSAGLVQSSSPRLHYRPQRTRIRYEDWP